MAGRPGRDGGGNARLSRFRDTRELPHVATDAVAGASTGSTPAGSPGAPLGGPGPLGGQLLAPPRGAGPAAMAAGGSGPCTPTVARLGRRQARPVDFHVPTIGVRGRTGSLYTRLLRRSTSRRLMHRFDLAARYVRDAAWGFSDVSLRPRTDGFSTAVSAVHRSALFGAFVRLVMVAHCLGIVVRDDDRVTGGEGFGSAVVVAELACFGVYFVDVLLGARDEGFWRFFGNVWNLAYAATALVLLSNLLASAATHDRLGLFELLALRPCLLLFRTERMRSVAAILLSSLPSAGSTLLLAAVLVCLYAALGVALFHGVYDEGNLQNFNSFPEAALAMAVLLTTENFPSVLLPALRVRPVVAASFFVSFIALGVWVYMSLLLAAIYDFYKHRHVEHVLNARVNEQQALLLAFSLLDDDHEVISFRTFRGLMRRVRPGASDEELAVLFKCLDVDRNYSLDAEEFTRLCDVMRYRLSPVDVAAASVQGRGALGRLRDLVMYPTPAVQKAVDGRAFRGAAVAALLASLVAVGMTEHGIGDDEAATVNAVSRASVAAFALEAVARVAALGLPDYARRHALDLAVLATSVPAEALLTLEPMREDGSVCWLQVARSVRVARLVTLWPGAMEVVRALARGVGTLAQMFGLLLVIFYMYAVVGMRLFRGALHDPERLHHEYRGWNPETFDTFWRSMLSLFQISTTNNWNNVMYSLINDVQHSVYFVSFFFVVCMIVLNVLTALIVDTYSTYREKRDLARERAAAAKAGGGTDAATDDHVFYTSASPPPSCPPSPVLSGVSEDGDGDGDGDDGDGEEEDGGESAGKSEGGDAGGSGGGGDGGGDGGLREPLLAEPKVAAALPEASPPPASSSAAGGAAGTGGPAGEDAPQNRHLCRSPGDVDAYNHRVWRVSFSSLWSYSAVQEELPQLRHRELNTLRQRVLTLQRRLDAVEPDSASPVSSPGGF